MVAPTLTQPVMPKQTYASPMSFTGSGRRISAWAKRVGARGIWLAVLAWAAALVTLVLVWAFLVVWNVVVFGLFGLLTFPYRLIRRSHRKSEALQKQQLATMQAILIQQQQAVAQNPQPPAAG